MKKKFNLNAAALLCTMAMTSLSAYSQDVTNFSDLKNAIESGGDTVDIQNSGNNIQFDSLLKYENKNVTITGQEHSSFTPTETSSNAGAFQATGGNLTITDVNFESFGEDSEKGVDFVIFSSGNVTLGPGVEFGSSIKTGNYRGGGHRGTIYMQNSTDNTNNLTLESAEGKDVVFSAQTDSGVSQPVDVFLFGKNINMEITGNDGNVEIGNGIASNGTNLTITHSGTNEFVLGGNNNNFNGTYTQNAAGTTTFKGTRYFTGESDIQSGSFNWEAEDDTGRGALKFGENTSLTVGDGSNTSRLTLSSKDTIAQTIHMMVQKDSELTIDGFNNRKALTLSNKIDGQGTLKLTSDDITFSGNSSGLSKDLKLTTQNANLTLTNMTSDTETLTTIAKGTNENTVINLNGYSGTDNTGLTVDGKAVKELNFSGTNNYTLGASKKLTVSAADGAEKAGVITNTANAVTTINGDVTVEAAANGNTPSLVNKFGAKLTINDTTGLENKGKVDNKGTLEAKTINNKGEFESTGSLKATSLINGDEIGISGAHLNSTGTFEVTGSVTNHASITGTTGKFGTYSGSDETSELNFTGSLLITGNGGEPATANAIQNNGSIIASAIEVTHGGIINKGKIDTTGDITLTLGDLTNGADGKKGSIKANNINVTGDIKNDVAESKIEATGKISANNVTNSGELIQGSELKFDSIENNTGKIESTSGDITVSGTADNENSGEIVSAGKLTAAGKLTNTGRIQMNGGELADVNNSSSGSITNTGKLAFLGTVTGSDPSAKIINNGGNITLTGSASGYTGTFEQNSGTTFANQDTLFGGIKDIKGGTLTASGTKMYSGEVNLSGDAKFNYTLNGAEGSITDSLLSFTNGGGSAEFTSDTPSNVYTLSDNITGENLGTVAFKNTSLKLQKDNGGNFEYKDFIFDNSTLQLGDSKSSDINDFTFNKFTAKNGSKVDLNVKFGAGNVLETDSLTLNSGSGTLGLGNIFISDEANVENGKNYATQKNQGVLRGKGAGVYGVKLSGSQEGVKGATTAFEYDFTVSDEQKGLTASVSKIADEHSLYKMDSDTNGERFFQFSTGDDKEYHIGSSLKNTLDGNFTVQGKSNTASESVLSGKLKKDGEIKEDEKGSFFNIVTSGEPSEKATGNVDLTVKNLTIQDADSTERGGSVLHNDSKNSSVVFDNLNIKDNSSSAGNGGAIYNNGGQGTDPAQAGFTGLYVHDVQFTGNSANGTSGKGGAIYNDTNGFMMLEDVTTDSATAEALNDIYNAGTAYTNGKNTFNSLFTNEKDITFQGENTLSEFVNSGSGNATFNGTKDVITEFTNSAKAAVNSDKAKIDSYSSTNGTLNFNSADATLGTVTGDTNSSITNSGKLTLTGNGSGYTGNFSQSAGNLTVDTGSTFFSGTSTVSGGMLNWFTENQPAGSKLKVSGSSTVLNVGDSTHTGKMTFKSDSSITEEVTTNIYGGSTLSVEGGDVALSNGKWLGDVSLTGGSLTLNNLYNVSKEGTGTLRATGGKLTLDGTTRLTLDGDSSVGEDVVTNITKDSAVSLKQGELTLDGKDTWNGAVVLDKTSTGTLTFVGYDTTDKGMGILDAQAGKIKITNNSNITFGGEGKAGGINKDVQTHIDKSSAVTLLENGYLYLNDDNPDSADTWEGKVNLEGGALYYGVQNPASVGELQAKSGDLKLLEGSLLEIKEPSNVEDKVAVDIQQGSTVDIQDKAKFNISGHDSETEKKDNWNGLVKNEGGEFTVSDMAHASGNGGGLQQTGGTSAFKDNSDIYISDKNSFIDGGDVVIDGNSKLSFGAGIKDMNAENLTMTDNTQLGIMNGEINSAHADNVNVTGTANYNIDINPRSKVADNFDFGSIKGDDVTLNVSDFNFTGGAPIDRNIDFRLFSNSDDNINFDATKDLKFTPIGYYGLQSLGEGNYRAYLDHYNPQVFRGQVATLAAYTQQLMVDDMITNHFILHNERQVDSAKNVNKYAAGGALFTPYQKTYEDGGLWAKTYVSLNKLDMTHNLNVGSNIWGTLVGADLPAVDLNSKWKFIPTGYVGYNAGHQHFNGVSMQQNGGQLGVMGTFIKDNDFITSVTAYGGGYTNDMDVAGFSDDTANWFAGSAVKSAYNFHPFKDFIFQPNIMAAYNAFGKQNWGTDFGIMSMSSNMMNGVNVAPGANLIFNKKTWSLYGTLSYMYFINDKIGGTAGNVNLPNVRMDHGYIQYGLGGTKTWKDRLSAYGQVTFRNAGITGVGFQAGLNYLFDLNLDKFKKKKAKVYNRQIPDTYIKKVYKTLDNNKAKA